MIKQIKSRDRVVNHGEVFTNEREVSAMLDMAASECKRIESRFLEPVCGEGNFLVELLRRKLIVVKKFMGNRRRTMNVMHFLQYQVFMV